MGFLLVVGVEARVVLTDPGYEGEGLAAHLSGVNGTPHLAHVE
jgi:hypothetical protein